MRSWPGRVAGLACSGRPVISCGTPALTRLREAGMALEAVQAQAGHLSIESTRVYLHLTNDWLAAEYRRAAALIDADTDAVAEMISAQEIGAAR